jgi:hypothetical protein
MQSDIESRISSLGSQTFMVKKWPGIYFGGPDGFEKYWRRKDITLAHGLQLQEKSTLARSVGVETSFWGGQIETRYKKSAPDVNLLGETPGSFPARNWVLKEGRALLDADVDGFRDVCTALEKLAARPDVQIVFPIHRNPNVRAAFSLLGDLANVKLIEPLDYLDFVYAQSKSFFILTDSGGVQEEAPSLGKPVLVMRAVTERPEAVSAGTVKLVGTNTDTIVSTAQSLLENPVAYSAMTAVHNPYGDGRACERIIASLVQDFDHVGC